MRKWRTVSRAACLWGLMLGILAAGTALAASPASKGCVMEELAEMPMIGAPLRPALKVLINGHPAILAIDTGSVTDLLFQSAAARLGLKPGAVVDTSYGVGGRSNMAMATVDTLEIGGLVGRRMQFLVPLTASEFEIDGFLGTGLVLQKDLEFDIPHNLIRFMNPRSCSGDAVVYWRQAYAVTPLLGDARQELIVQVTVNGHPVRAQIDSAVPRSSITVDTARSVGIPLGPNAAPRQDAIGGIGAKQVDSVLGRMETFGFGDEVIHNTEILVADFGKFQREKQLGSNIATNAVDDEPEMLLGADFLCAHRVYIAESQRRIYISYEGGPVFEIHPDHTDTKSAPAPQDGAKPPQ